ncbi:MAG TPA: hypothetical protein ENI46_03355, partial [Firmicutes bacterium]|nr:hypothetical protein [Bacillota bacterium]
MSTYLNYDRIAEKSSEMKAMDFPRKPLFASLELGIMGTSAQIVLLRELLVAFTGNELTFAIALAIWLVSVSIGSLVMRRSSLLKNQPTAVSTLLIMAGLVSVIQVILIRAIKPAIIAFGEIPGPATILLMSLVGIVPFGFIAGCLFVAIVAFFEASRLRHPIPFAYGLETLGSAIVGGGLAVLLLERLNPSSIIATAAVVGLVVACFMAGGRRYRAIGVTLAGLVAVIGIVGGHVDLKTRSLEWKPLKVVTSVDTRYGNIVVTSRDGMNDFYENGILTFSLPDALLAEEAVHIPLLLHPSPRDVLIIGGIGSGVVHEIAKHPSVRSIDYVDLDPRMIEVVTRFAPQGWLKASGVRVTGVYGDGRRYVETTQRRYDAVIVNVGEPLTLQICRYYTLEFFERVAVILKPRGIVALTIPSEGSYLGPERASLIAAIKVACEQAVGNVTILPGDYVHIIASPDLDLEDRVDALIETYNSRRITTAFVTPPSIAARLLPLAKAQVDSTVESFGAIGASVDDHPISFTHSIGIWAKHFRSGRAILALIRWVSFGRSIWILIILGFGLPLVFLRHRARRPQALIGALAIFAMGFSSMLAQVLLLLCFQALSGYIYVKVALIIAGFMLGMGAAAVLAGSYPEKLGSIRHLLVLQLLLLLLPLGIVTVFDLFRIQRTAMALAEVIFGLLAFSTGS